MDYKKEYEEALKRAKSCLKDGGITNIAIAYIQSIFPELLEEDENKLIDSLMQYLRDLNHKDFNPPKPDMKTCDKWISCIQKLCKKKFNTEDRCIIQDTISICGRVRKKATNEIDYENATRCIDWLKSLKDRVQPQQKQDWSEEDKEYMDRIHEALYDYYPNIEAKGIYDWFCKQLTKLWIVWKQ